MDYWFLRILKFLYGKCFVYWENWFNMLIINFCNYNMFVIKLLFGEEKWCNEDF